MTLVFMKIMEFTGKCRLKAIRRWMKATANTEAMKTGYSLEEFGEGGESLLAAPLDNWAYTDVLKQERVSRRRSPHFLLSWEYCIHMSGKASLLRMERSGNSFFPQVSS